MLSHPHRTGCTLLIATRVDFAIEGILNELQSPFLSHGGKPLSNPEDIITVITIIGIVEDAEDVITIVGILLIISNPDVLVIAGVKCVTMFFHPTENLARFDFAITGHAEINTITHNAFFRGLRLSAHEVQS